MLTASIIRDTGIIEQSYNFNSGLTIFIATHEDFKRSLALDYFVMECRQFGHHRHQTGVLALYAHLLPHFNLVSLPVKHITSFVMGGLTRAE